MSSLIVRDKKVIWHPYTQMLNASIQIPIVNGKGSLLFDESGKSYIDAISSWWTNLHGHCHPYISERISQQLKELDHVIFAGFTHPNAIRLAERILNLTPANQSKVFYSDNGSTAVEVAIKMSIQFWKNTGRARKRIIAFHHSYHGDTFGSMSISGRGAFTHAFNDYLFEVDFIPAPIQGTEDKTLQILKSLLQHKPNEHACFIYEPLIQGAAGMVMHSSTALNALISECKANEIHCIADEVMTGFGRTGEIFASNSIKTDPDIICLSKGITGGTMALGMTTCSENIYEAFLGTDQTKTFFHGHSYTANPIACSAALASLDLLENEDCTQKRKYINLLHLDFMRSLSSLKSIRDIRITGTILAIEIESDEISGYFNSKRDVLYQHFLNQGIIMRPLGNVLYIMPPYCITDEELHKIYDSIIMILQKN